MAMTGGKTEVMPDWLSDAADPYDPRSGIIAGAAAN
jgi:hypothetical protein